MLQKVIHLWIDFFYIAITAAELFQFLQNRFEDNEIIIVMPYIRPSVGGHLEQQFCDFAVVFTSAWHKMRLP